MISPDTLPRDMPCLTPGMGGLAAALLTAARPGGSRRSWFRFVRMMGSGGGCVSIEGRQGAQQLMENREEGNGHVAERQSESRERRAFGHARGSGSGLGTGEPWVNEGLHRKVGAEASSEGRARLSRSLRGGAGVCCRGPHPYPRSTAARGAGWTFGVGEGASCPPRGSGAGVGLHTRGCLDGRNGGVHRGRDTGARRTGRRARDGAGDGARCGDSRGSRDRQ